MEVLRLFTTLLSPQDWDLSPAYLPSSHTLARRTFHCLSALLTLFVAYYPIHSHTQPVFVVPVELFVTGGGVYSCL